jgi:hypothetical protein
MAQIVIVLWRDIPTQVIVKAGRNTARRELPSRFVVAVDQAAMRAGMTGSDSYLEAWRRSDPIACSDDLEMEASAAAAALDARYPAERLRALVDALGVEEGAVPAP